MSDTNKKTTQEAELGFMLRGITTEQFAILRETFNQEEELEIISELRFAKDIKAKMLGVFGKFTFEQAKNTLLTIEAGCHFQIVEDGWSHLCPDEQAGIITLPKGFALHLATIVVGTARGILHVRVEQTAYNMVVLPTIDLTTMILDDVIIE